MELSIEQLNFFNQNGFIILRDFLKADECNKILDVAHYHLEEKIEPIETETCYKNRSKEYRTDVVDYSSDEEVECINIRRLRQVYDRDILFKQWMENIDIREPLHQILNDDVVLVKGHHNSIMTKMPNTSRSTSWHQDRRYWNYSDDNLVSVWLALDDEYSDNGVLEFIPGSHKISLNSDQFDDKEYFKEDNILNIPLINSKISSSLSKGDVIIFHSLLLHRANKNCTKKAKISFVYTVKGRKTKAGNESRSSKYEEVILGNV